MKNIHLLAFYTAGSLVLGGCSGHVLQDWADETFNEKPVQAVKNEEKDVSKVAETVPETTPETVEKAADEATAPLPEAPTASVEPEAAPVAAKPKSHAPSQNTELDRVSPMPIATSENGIMQQKMDTWIEEEWTPTIEKNATIKAMNEDEERPFTLQEYVDKAEEYMKNQPKSDTPLHSQTINAMPVIGK